MKTMIRTTFFILFLTSKFFSQDLNEKTEIISLQSDYLQNCFNNLQPFEELAKFPAFENEKFCNLDDCLLLFEFKEEFIRKLAIDRIKKIAQLFVNEGKYIVLTSGMDSFYDSNQKNLNINDDNGRIYISVSDCLLSKGRSEAIDIFNLETKKLIHE